MITRIISLWQPFATLIFTPSIHDPGRMAKENETRGSGWNTRYRGLLGIHATASMPKYCRDLLKETPFAEHLSGKTLPQGMIIGTVELVSIQTTENYLESVKPPLDIKPADRMAIIAEIYFGDYSENRFVWKLQNARLFDQPIPAKGKQGFWNYDLPNQ